MKTGFLYGNARTTKFVYYSYHGKIMQCRKEPWIPPYIYYDTHPAEYPPNYYYECDTMPDGATPPMTGGHSPLATITIGGGLFDARQDTEYTQRYVDTAYRWLITPTAKIEITALFPTMEIDEGYRGYVRAGVYLRTDYSMGVWAQKDYTIIPGHPHMYHSETYIKKDSFWGWYRPYTNNFHIIFEKIPGIDKWNFYFNDEWIFDVERPRPNAVNFYISFQDTKNGHATMDYIRAWKDKERF